LGVRLGDVVMSCSDPVRMPTSMDLATPKGGLVMNNAPMVIDARGIAFAAGMAGLFKMLGAAFRACAKVFFPLRGRVGRSAVRGAGGRQRGAWRAGRSGRLRGGSAINGRERSASSRGILLMWLRAACSRIMWTSR